MNERRHTPDSVREELMVCKTEVGQQVESLRAEFKEHKDTVDQLVRDWDEFKKDFAEMLIIFRSAKGAFVVIGWIGSLVKWAAICGAAIGALWIFLKTGHWPGIK